MRVAISKLLTTHHPNALKKDLGQIAIDIGITLQIDFRIIERVIEKIASDQDAESQKPEGGRKPWIKPGTAKANRLVGALKAGFVGRHTASKINELGVPPGKKLILRQVVRRAVNHTFGLVCSKLAIIETVSR